MCNSIELEKNSVDHLDIESKLSCFFGQTTVKTLSTFASFYVTLVIISTNTKTSLTQIIIKKDLSTKCQQSEGYDERSAGNRTSLKWSVIFFNRPRTSLKKQKFPLVIKVLFYTHK